MIFFPAAAQNRAAEKFQIPYFGEIPITTALREGGDAGVPILIQDPNSPVSKSFLDIAAQAGGAIVDRLRTRPENSGTQNRFELSQASKS